MRVLVTRPEADAAALVAALEARGHEALVQPLLTIEPAVPEPPLDLAGVQALLFTSANGVRAFADVSRERGLPVFAVGDASAEAARAAGFAKVESAGGDVEDLARLVKGRLEPGAGPLLHGAGGSLAGDLKGELEGAGFEVRRSVLYKAEPVRELSGSVRAALSEGRLDAVLFFSPRTAKTFVRLVAGHGLAAACERCQAVCLSAAVAANLGALSWRGIRTAAEANQQALLACLDDTDRVAAAGNAGQGDIMAQDSASLDPEPGAEPPPGASPAQTVILAFGGIRPMAHKLGVAVSTVQGWKERGVIPANRHGQVRAAAAANGIDLDEAAFAQPGKPRKPRLAKARAPEPQPAAAPERPAQVEVLPPLDREQERPPQPEAPAPEPPAPETAPPTARPARGRGATAFVLTVVVLALAAAGAFMTRDLWYPGGPGEAEDVQTALREPEAVPAPAEAPPPPEQVPPEPSEPAEALVPPAPEPSEAAVAPEPEPEPVETAVPPQPEPAAAAPEIPARPVPPPAPDLVRALDELGAELRALQARLGRLEGRATEPAASSDQLAALGAEMSAFQARLGRLEDHAAAPAASSDQLAALAAAEEALGERIAALEARLAGLDRIEQRIEALARDGGPLPTGGDVALMLALEQLREALARGGPYAGELDLLSGVVGADSGLADLLAPLQGHAAAGVPSRAALARDFPVVARAVIADSAGGESEGLMSGMLRRLSDVVTVRPVGDVEGGDPGPVVARAEHRLQAGDLAGALGELDALDGPAAEAAAGWRARAEARLSVETALSALRARAIARLMQAGG
jgi:uroporphyrinogen-III synthase